jgi:hypothetical protein
MVFHSINYLEKADTLGKPHVDDQLLRTEAAKQVRYTLGII